MDIVDINGFKFRADKKGIYSLILEGYDLPEELRQLDMNQICRIETNRLFHQGRITNLDFLKNYPEIKGVWVCDDCLDCSGLYYLDSLEELGGEVTHIDYSRFPALKSLRVSWWKGFPDLSRNKELKHLMLRSFNPKSRSLTELSLPDDIAFFELDFSNISDLTGLPAGVVDLELAYCRNLQGLRGLERSRQTLRSFIVQNCRALSDYGVLEECLKLEKIILDKCGELPSISWTEKLEELKHFTFADTHVADGNLDPLFRIPYIYFTNSRDYNHRMKDFDSYRWYDRIGKGDTAT